MRRLLATAVLLCVTTNAMAEEKYILCGHGYVRALISENKLNSSLPGGMAILLDEHGLKSIELKDTEYWDGASLSPGKRNIVIDAPDPDENITAQSAEALLRLAFSARLPVEIFVADKSVTDKSNGSCNGAKASAVVVKVCGIEDDCNTK